MTNPSKAGIAVFLVLVLPVAAQRMDARPQAANHTAGEQNRQQPLVLHALNQAITGIRLQFAAQSVRGGRPQANQGQEAHNRQERRDARLQDRTADRQDDNQNRQRHSQINQQLAGQLEPQARQEFTTSARVLDDVKDAMQSNVGTDHRAGWTSRLHAAANRHADTLPSLPWRASGRRTTERPAPSATARPTTRIRMPGRNRA
jgi:hypothetical protein